VFGGGDKDKDVVAPPRRARSLGASTGFDSEQDLADDGAEEVSAAGTYQCVVKARRPRRHTTHARTHAAPSMRRNTLKCVKRSPTHAHPRRANAPARTTHAQIVEAKNVYAIQRFSLAQLRRNIISSDRVPSAFVTVKLLRGDGTETRGQRTVVRKNTSTPLYESLFYFNDIHVAEGELASCVLQVCVYDRGRLGPHMLVGAIDMDLESVYQLPSHELWRQWVTVLEPRGKREGPQGMVKLCVTVLAKGDKPLDHAGENADDDDDGGIELGDLGDLGGLDFSALGGPSAKAAGGSTVAYGLRCQAYCAMDLPRMDWLAPGAGVQPYLQISAGSKAARTRRRRGAAPQWRQELSLTMQLPPEGTGAPPIRITLFDANVTTADVPIASMKLTYASIRRDAEFYRKPRWYPLYGAPRDSEAEFHLRAGAKLARRMNNGYVEGSDYRGAVFLAIEAGKETELNPAKRRGLPMPDMKPPVNLIMVAEVLQLDMVLPEERGMGAEVAVEVTYGMASVWTKMWYEAKSMRPAGGDIYVQLGEKLQPFNARVPAALERESDDGSSAPDVFVNIWWSSPTVKKRRVAYGRVPMAYLMPPIETDFPEEAPEASTGGWCGFQQWLPLQADALGVRKGSSTVRNARPQGAVLMRLQLARKTGGVVRAHACARMCVRALRVKRALCWHRCSHARLPCAIPFSHSSRTSLA
jgi:hypothetical protein